jgi:outer membrane usher protein
MLLRRQDLPTIGLALTLPTVVVVDGAEHVALDQTAGLALALDQASLTLAITAEPRLLTRQVIDAAPRAPAVARLRGEGAFLNWALERSASNGASSAPTSLGLEAGARLGPTLWLSRGQTVRDAQGDSRFVRLTTSVTRDVPERLVRWTLGDIATTSDELGQGVLLGGISLGTLARLDPYRIRYPLGTVQGQALIASEVDVYVDGQRVRTERVPAGVFEIRDLNTPPVRRQPPVCACGPRK